MLRKTWLTLLVPLMVATGCSKQTPVTYFEDPWGSFYNGPTNFCQSTDQRELDCADEEQVEQFKEEQINNFLKSLNNKDNTLYVAKCENLRNRELCEKLGGYDKTHTVRVLNAGGEWKPDKQYIVVIGDNKVKSFAAYDSGGWFSLGLPKLHIVEPRFADKSYSLLEKVREALEASQ